MTPIEFYFDFASPYGLLAAMQIDRIEQPIVWRPFLLGAVYKKVGQSPLVHPLSATTSSRSMPPRMARHFGLTLKVPYGFPDHSWASEFPRPSDAGLHNPTILEIMSEWMNGALWPHWPPLLTSIACASSGCS
jgi:hypothetical protein